MRSSTSNSELFEKRDIPQKPLGVLFVLAIAITIVGLGIAEWQVRKAGYVPSRMLDLDFWANHRFKLDAKPEDQTVLLGASRMSFGLDHDQWEESTGQRPFNLSLHGASFLPMLTEYAQNDKFKGTVVCSYAPGFTFANEVIPFSERLLMQINKLEDDRHSLAIRASEWTGSAIQGNLAILNQYVFAPVSMSLDFWHSEQREKMYPPFWMPRSFHRTSENSDQFVDEVIDQPWCIEQWDILHKSVIRYKERFEPRDFEKLLHQMKQDVEQIRNRGGEVILVRFPVAIWFREWEEQHFPRNEYWDVMIEETGCRSFHFLDHDETQSIIPPDASHMKVSQAKQFTKALAQFIYALQDGQQEE